MTRQVWRTTRQGWRTTRQGWRMTRQLAQLGEQRLLKGTERSGEPPQPGMAGHPASPLQSPIARCNRRGPSLPGLRGNFNGENAMRIATRTLLTLILGVMLATMAAAQGNKPTIGQ